MLSLSCFTGMIIVIFYGFSDAKLHYAVVFPSEVQSQRSELVCLHLVGMLGETSVQLVLERANGNITLFEKNLQESSFLSCIPFQVPEPSDGNEEVAMMYSTIHHAGNSIYRKSKLLLRGEQTAILIQTDKAIYKPGQTVKFRVVLLNENFLPGKSQLPAVELQDPEKNLIGQWLNVSLRQGIAELSLPLSSELPLGGYSIRVKDTVHTFSVEEYVLPKFEVTLHFPKFILITDERFTLQVCGRYTYGKPMKGDYKVQVCRKHLNYYVYGQSVLDDLCVDLSGKLDTSGCSTLEMSCEAFQIRGKKMKDTLFGKASIKDEGTGIMLSSTSDTRISDVLTKVDIIGPDTYKPGIPLRIQVKVTDSGSTTIPGIAVYLTCKMKSDTIMETLVTGPDGIASYNITNTTDWQGRVSFTATLNQTDDSPPDESDYRVPTHLAAYLHLEPFSSQSKSYIMIHAQDNVLPCEGQQEIKVHYIIKGSELREGVSHLHLHYLVVSKFSIKYSGQMEIPIRSINKDEQGDTVLNFPLSADMVPTFRVLSYILLPNGDAVADSAQFNTEKCFRNKVSVGFFPGEVFPKSDVSLEVLAAPGSLCGLRVVDESVLLMKAEKELTADKVFDLFPMASSHTYNRKVEDEITCKPRRFYTHNYRFFGRTNNDEIDVCTYFEDLSLKIITSANIKSSQKTSRRFFGSSYNRDFEEKEDTIAMGAEMEEHYTKGHGSVQESVIRHYFPETWIWKLEAVGDSGIAVLHDTAPDTITDWHGGAFCMGPAGFGLSPSASFRVFQPFFVDITLPYSVIRGEKFTLKATVFNYLKQCIMVRSILHPSVELEEKPCPHCQYSSCLCVDESTTFYWFLKASKLGQVNVTVTTEALDTQELCHNEVPMVPKLGNIDTVVKPLLVQPGGLLKEKSYSALLCSQAEEDSKVEEISLKIPENILEDSERAHIVVNGDLMGTSIQNLDRLLAMPHGCGEQNMVLFSPNIFILQYLEKTHQLNSEIKNKATKFLESGYQRELTYKHDDGSYSAFGRSDESGNTWLTAFVVKSFSKARPYIFIDEKHLKHSFSWLKKKQQPDGCFRTVGRLFNNAMMGGVTDKISLSTYVTIALLEAGVSIEDPLVKNAVSCLRTAAGSVTNVYNQALLVYAFTLSGDKELREALMDKLEAQVVRGNKELHWERLSKPQSEDSYWSRAPSAEVEMTSYVLLALLSGPTKDLDKASQIVNWLSKQSNPYGGFSSTQDTVVALQALATFAEATFNDKGDVMVTVASKTEFNKQFHVNKNNRLLLQSESLPSVPGEYTVRSSGSGCVYVQTVLRYNVPLPRGEETFAIEAEARSSECVEDPVTKLEIKITAQYKGSREKSNMVVIDVKMLSGYIPVKSSVRQLERNKLMNEMQMMMQMDVLTFHQDKLERKKFIMRSEIQMDMVTLYLEEMGRDPVNFSFFVEQDKEVEDLKPAIVKIYDYYETDEHAVAEYTSPCNGQN